ncbi:class I SAM-dependent methyltransferase [Streptacidiphilus melanogenes]|uniref:class I SAM-dependent methyltransferase n=1 Tax=Streptacidiphilus melanogenes TaxID=411235 RepID=UPI0005A9340C|nr:class I SAM-dependent methyltransferase [Streptacidiphilus melanogenes]
MRTTRVGHSGTGPGAITPDGCAVELYTRLPAGDEPDVVARAAPRPGASILELGCGVGRVTHPLVERGFVVTAVDESPEMLERVRGARTVLSSIEDLALGERFDVVLLASFLVNTGDLGVRAALLATCLRHVAADGVVLVQREGEGFYDVIPREQVMRDGVGRMAITSSEEIEPGLRANQVDYVFPDAHWTQFFRTRHLPDAAFEHALAEAGLELDAYLTPDHVWARALPS